MHSGSEKRRSWFLVALLFAAGDVKRSASLSAVGSLLMKSDPSLDPRNFGCRKLGELAKAQPYLVVKAAPAAEGQHHLHLFVRVKMN